MEILLQAILTLKMFFFEKNNICTNIIFPSRVG